MTNPVTQKLVRQLNDGLIAQFVAHWDNLEELVIRVYRAQQATPDDGAAFSVLQRALLDHYPHWQDALHPYWRQARVGGEPAQEDPFAALLRVGQPQDFVGNWQAMQTLPAARQALNEWLMDMLGN